MQTEFLLLQESLQLTLGIPQGHPCPTNANGFLARLISSAACLIFSSSGSGMVGNCAGKWYAVRVDATVHLRILGNINHHRSGRPLEAM